jgi:hypothetical protein
MTPTSSTLEALLQQISVTSTTTSSASATTHA